MPIPSDVTQKQVRKAIKPLLTLLGTNYNNIFSIEVGGEDDTITLVVPIDHESDPDGRARSMAVVGDAAVADLPPHPQTGRTEPWLALVRGDSPLYYPEWAYRVRVHVKRPR